MDQRFLEPPAEQYDRMFGQEDYAHLLTVAEMLGPDVGRVRRPKV